MQQQPNNKFRDLLKSKGAKTRYKHATKEIKQVLSESVVE
jgi:hypothetical protein